MKMELNAVVFNSTSWDVEELGTLRTSLEKGDAVKFGKMKADKRVVVLITEKGQEAPNKQVVASAPVSAMIKNAIKNGADKKAVLKAALALNVIKNDKGFFLVAPAGEIGESFTLDAIDSVSAVELVPADLVA